MPSARVPDHEAAIASAPYLRHRRTHRSRAQPRPRLLQLLATGSIGGAQESYTGLLLRLDRARYEVRALSLSTGGAVQRLRRLGLEVDVISETDDEAAVRDLTAYLRRHEIDLVHAHMYRAEVVGVRAAVAAGTPVVVATVHSSRVRSRKEVQLLARLTPFMDRLIVPSRSNAEKVIRDGRNAAPFEVIPNGIDLERFEVPPGPCTLRQDLAIPHDAVLVGVVARLEGEKGHRYLIDAMASVIARAPSVWLVLVGEGSREAELRRRAGALPDQARDRVVFAGRRDDVAAVTGELDIAVLPSLREAQGISILEAMARRRPVVASAIGGVPEVVTDGLDGLLVASRDSAALAEAIVRLARDPALRASLGEAGYRTVVERFSISAMVRRVEGVYDEELLRSGAVARLRGTRPGSRAAAAASSAPERAALEVP